MKKLFVIGIGGNVSKANIEVHDVQFIIAETLSDTYDILKRDWYGNSLHIDGYKILDGIDGYRIQLESYPQQTELNLFFINMGGYVKDCFNEMHEFSLFAAVTESEAKEKAKEQLLKHVSDLHIDNICNVKDCLKFADGGKNYIHIIPETKSYNMHPDWSGYIKLK
ncbi:MAG: DUF1543 domain-containing protein [Acidaminococcaceae bacterium]|nr:DUF1543 domain-containing protein [Acidaminococcaceae bacterium]MDD4721840.1 DUF1543 domain-containing protein [Acidaminococcaceae bacterium]